MGMVDRIVMELKGFWIIGLVRVIWEALKNEMCIRDSTIQRLPRRWMRTVCRRGPT